ncbi:MAG: DNA topoisomerase, partial [Planctomycetia bacterium]
RPHEKAERLFSREKAEGIVADVAGKTGLASETRRPSREAPPPLFDLTSLQREANGRFGWSAIRTLGAAQRCYEAHKVLTYPRTDSRCLPSDYRDHVDNVTNILANGSVYASSARFLLKNGRQNEAKIFNDAGVKDHFAIIPTGQPFNGLEGDDKKLFDLVVRRFLAAFHPPAVWEQVERKTIVAGHQFLSRARTLREPGWRAVLDQEGGDADSSKLPPLVPGTEKADDVPTRAETVDSIAEETKPPPRITEARLLSLMENAGKQVEDEEAAAALSEKGLGTPATRAEIIENLKSKEYVDQALRPTNKGIRIIDLLRRIHADRLTSAQLTGELEHRLDEVERGVRPAASFMDEVKDYTRTIVDAVRSFSFDAAYPEINPCGTCPCDKKKPVFERSLFYRCKEDPALIGTDNDCPFRVWKDKSGRYMDRNTVEILLRDGKTPEIDGFRDRQGRTFKGSVELVNMEVVLKAGAGTPEGGGDAAPVFEVNAEPLGPDPVHKDDPEDVVIETPTYFISKKRLQGMQNGEKKLTGFMLPRVVCRRTMTREDALVMMAQGETPLIEDFISRFNKPFKAKLKMRPDGKHDFDFPPREGGGKGRFKKKGAAPAAEGAEGAAAAGEAVTSAPKKKTTKKAAAKPAAKKKGATKKAAPKKATKKRTFPETESA